MEGRARRIDLEEPVPDWEAGARVLEHREERLAPGHAPLDVRCADAAARLEQDLPVDRAVTDGRQVDRDRGRRAGAAARVHPEMRGQERVAEGAWLEREARVAADHRPPALGLVGPQEHPGAIERGERALETVGLDQPLEIAPFAAGEPEQPGVRAPGHGVDRAPDEIEEDPVALTEPLADYGVRRGSRRGPPEEAR